MSNFTLYIFGDLEISPSNDENIKFIRSIKSRYGQTFGFNDDGTFCFKEQIYESVNPYKTDIIKPLEKLINYCKDNDYNLSGELDIECPDYAEAENIVLTTENNNIIKRQAVIAHAPKEELLDELKYRGIIDEELFEELSNKEENIDIEL